MSTKMLFLVVALLFVGIAYPHYANAYHSTSTSTSSSEDKGFTSWVSRLFTRNASAKASDGGTNGRRQDECLDKVSGTWILCSDVREPTLICDVKEYCGPCIGRNCTGVND
jgi:hypothetical protein